VQCNSCEHIYCDKCWWDGIGHKCECGSCRKCVEFKDGYCDSCGINGSSCGSPLYVKDETKFSDDASIEGNSDSHPWHGIHFISDIMDEFLNQVRSNFVTY
jgi:hypothetical protein